jgi:hypothetical protein
LLGAWVAATRCAATGALPRIYGMVKRMKALKSPLAVRLLADPKTREQLRNFLTGAPSNIQYLRMTASA